MAVRIRMKKMGRRHRPFFRICAMDGRSPRDGRVIEDLGHYDPMLKETDARAVLKSDRIDYWLSVGAQPSDNVRVLIKKYGTDGTHLEQQKAAFERLKIKPAAPAPVAISLTQEAPPAEAAAEAPVEEAATAETSTSETADEQAAPTEEAAGESAEEEAKPEATE